ncbi:MAG: hypothetical protein M3Y49_01965 [Actinomycetota bacterium]|nr:hypothetical protein [Actinomycetota bacterium]
MTRFVRVGPGRYQRWDRPTDEGAEWHDVSVGGVAAELPAERSDFIVDGSQWGVALKALIRSASSGMVRPSAAAPQG